MPGNNNALTNPLASLREVLNQRDFSDDIYSDAVARWPSERCIWDDLDSRTARENFARFIVARDNTDSVAYDARFNRCMSFAAQFYARYSLHSRLDGAAHVNLRQVDVFVLSRPRKLLVPAYIAINGPHAFNAILVNPTTPRRLDDYMILEPQTDEFISREDPRWSRYIERGGVVFHNLDGFPADLRYDLSPRHGFLLNGDGDMIHTRSDKVVKLARDFAIADSGQMNFDAYVTERGHTYAEFILHQLANVWRVDDDELIALGRALTGRKFRVHPDAPLATMTPDRFVSLVGRADLLTQLAA